MTEANRADRAVPSWVPVDVRNYVFHTEMGQPIRVLARAQDCHASTIMRQVRKVEQRRDDPLVDRAIKDLAQEGDAAVPAPTPIEIMQALRRLAAPDALLAIALGMEQGVILQDIAGQADHGSKLPLSIAAVLALQGWIASSQTAAKVLRYRITPAGRGALRDLMAQSENHARAMAEGPAGFKGAPTGIGPWDDKPTQVRPASIESPVMALSRRKDRDGRPFLDRPLVRAAERLREEYELAQVGRLTPERPAVDWTRVLAAIEAHEPVPTPEGSAAQHVMAALVFLGPGLAGVALRCCCLLEGLETTEQDMGWAARSGKVVLRIALQRLVLHYEACGGLGPRIG